MTRLWMQPYSETSLLWPLPICLSLATLNSLKASNIAEAQSFYPRKLQFHWNSCLTVSSMDNLYSIMPMATVLTIGSSLSIQPLAHLSTRTRWFSLKRVLASASTSRQSASIMGVRTRLDLCLSMLQLDPKQINKLDPTIKCSKVLATTIAHS